MWINTAWAQIKTIAFYEWQNAHRKLLLLEKHNGLIRENEDF